MQITVTLSQEQTAGVEAAAAKTGQDREQIVLQAIDYLILREELGPDGYARLMASLADEAAGRFATDAQVDAVFRKYGARKT